MIMAHLVMAYIVLAYIAMAYIVMAYIVMASMTCCAGLVLRAVVDVGQTAEGYDGSLWLLVAIDHWAELVAWSPTRRHFCVNVSGVPPARRGVAPIRHTRVSLVNASRAPVFFFFEYLGSTPTANAGGAVST